MMEKFLRAFIYSVGPDGVTPQTLPFSFEGDNSDARAVKTAGLLMTSSYPVLFNGSTFDRQRSAVDNADAVAVGSLGLVGSMARQQVFNGVSWDRVRTPNLFHSVYATAAGNTIVWTPAAGKRFRLMGYSMVMTGDSTFAAAGQQVVTLLDSATPIAMVNRAYVPAAAANVFGGYEFPDTSGLGNGYLSSAINQSLNINLSTAFVTGGIIINVWGLEE